MLNLLQRLLAKKGIRDVSELENYERDDFDRWGKILSEGEVTVESIKEGIKGYIRIVEGQMKNLDNSKEKNERLINQLVTYKTLLELIDSKGIEKENLERYLQSLIK